MKRLYKVNVMHVALKDKHESIQGYLIANTEEEVMDFIDIAFNYGLWKDGTKDEETKYDSNLDKSIPIRDFVLKYRGNMVDDDYSDAYYGITRFSWEEVLSARDVDMDLLMKIGVAQDARKNVETKS